MKYKPLPIGVDDFEMVITRGYYFVDKSLFIKELLDRKGAVNLFTRPRRFGKTLNMSMLQYFFEDMYDFHGKKKENAYLFEGLEIMDAGEEYLSHMGKYPVISLSLKAGKQKNFHMAYALLCRQIAKEYERHRYILEKEELKNRKEKYMEIMMEKASEEVFADSIQYLSECLYLYSGQKVIILIDEYDVPLENAYVRGFYQEMVDFIRSLFESALKTNASLEFAVLTGCLRISKESIFTGMNNLRIYSILTENYGEYFGFTEEEAKKLCEDYGIPENYAQLKDWYDGYLFGETEVYNPWSTIQYVCDHYERPDAFPSPYWANTSGNAIVRTLIDKADREVKDELEVLIAGGTIEKPVHEDITYDEVYQTMDNLWNFMFFTGYFKKAGERFQDRVRYVTMKIPNQEVLYIFENKVRDWFAQKLKERNPDRLLEAVVAKDTDTMEEEITRMLYTSISFYDYYETFYHGFLAGILYGMEYYVVKSNRESGNGRTDLYLKPASFKMPAYLFEFKCAKKEEDMEKMAEGALKQIHEKKYDEELRSMGYKKIIRYGIAFCGKDCVVKVDEAMEAGKR